VAAAQFPGLGIEQFEIFEMVDIHGPVPDRSRLDRMSYVDLPASMCKPCANFERALPLPMLVSGGSARLTER
jgi:hypothetical protein